MDEPVVSTPEIAQRSAATEPQQGYPAHWGIDREPARRPGVPRERSPRSWPNTRFPPQRQQGSPSSPMHGRPGKALPPVFGTAVPLRGLSGVVRRLGYRYPDHVPRHWVLELLGDRVDSWTRRLRRAVLVAAPIALLALILGRRRA